MGGLNDLLCVSGRVLGRKIVSPCSISLGFLYGTPCRTSDAHVHYLEQISWLSSFILNSLFCEISVLSNPMA